MISPVSNSINFKAVYYSPEGLTNDQMNTANSIVSKFKSLHYIGSFKETYEKSLEQKKVDFLITPDEDGVSVNLFAHKLSSDIYDIYGDADKNFKPDKTYLRVGKYNNRRKFDINDVSWISFDGSEVKALKIYSFIMSALMLITVPTVKYFTEKRQQYEQAILNANAAQHGRDTLKNDTIKFVPKINKIK